MKIKLDELANIPEKKLTVHFHEVIDELNNDIPVDGKIEISLQPYGVKISGQVETDLLLDCDRCLEKYLYHVSTEIDEKYINEKLVAEDVKEFELKSDSFVEELNGRDEIDLTDLIYQSVILSEPTQKLCTQECPGSSDYQQLKSEKPIDPRMEIFKKLSEQIEE